MAQYQQALFLSYRSRATLHRRANEIPEAIAALDQGLAVLEKLAQTTTSAKDRAFRIQCYFEKLELCLLTGKEELAADAFRKANALNPTDPLVLYRCGSSLMNKGRLEEAAVALTRAVALKPAYAEAQCNLGHCLVRQGRFAEGRAALHARP